MSAAAASPPAATPLKLTWPRVLRSEWTKLWSLRSSVYTLLTAAVVMVGFGLIFAAAAQTTSANRTGPPGTSDPATVSLGGVYLAQLVIAVLGVLLISAELPAPCSRSVSPAPRPVKTACGAAFIGRPDCSRPAERAACRRASGRTKHRQRRSDGPELAILCPPATANPPSPVSA